MIALVPDTARWILEIGFVVYAAVVTVIVVLERRRPTATVALLFALIFVPLVGLFVYLVLARRLRRRLDSRKRRAVQPVDASREFLVADALPENAAPSTRGLIRLAQGTAAAPVRWATGVRLLSDPVATFDAMYDAIDHATQTVHVMFYIWRNDETGRAMVARLAARARAGVRVRVVLDHLGSFGLADAHFQPLLDAGGEVALFGRLRFPWRPWRSRMNFRNHRKLLVVDGERGFLGGVNIGDEYSGHTTHGVPVGAVWRDVMVEITGDAVFGLEAVFLEDWLAACGEVVDAQGNPVDALRGIDARRPVPRRMVTAGARERERRLRAHDPWGALGRRHGVVGKALVQIIPSGPDAPAGDAIATQVVAAASTASDRVWIVTPYFVPDEPLLMALRTAALRGVDVRIIVPTAVMNDSRLVAYAAASHYDELMDAGVRIFEYRAAMLHAKYAVFDTASLVGSANMDIRSFHLNYEIVAMFYDSAVTAAMVGRFSEDLTLSREITAAQRESIRWPRRVAEAVARVASPLL
jgi:cardiolipin synthase